MLNPADVADKAFEAWRPPARLNLSEWADAHFYLSAESSAEPGRWTTLPTQRGVMDAFTDPRVFEVVCMKSARVGWTKVLNALIGYHIHHDPCTTLLIQPTIVDAKGYSKEEIAPMLRDCAAIASKFTEELHRKNSLLHKRYPGGLLQIVGARSPASFRRVSRRGVLGDEVDGYPPSAGQEGDPIALATRRSEYFWNRFLAWGSTPTLAGASRIEQLYAASDQRRYYVPCPHCDHTAPFVFQRATDEASDAPKGHVMRWTKGQPETAHFVCQGCGSVIEHPDKRRMIEAADRRQQAGEPGIGWVAHAPFTGRAGFHWWSAYSYSPNATWPDIVRAYEHSVDNRELLKTFINTWLGETWKEEADAPDWELLYDRRDDYAIGTCPCGVLFLTAGVDVQKDRVVVEVVGWGRGARSWSIDAFVIPGDTSDATDHGPWPKVDALVNRTFIHEGGAALRLALLAVDSGFNTQDVYRWARRHERDRVIAVKGIERSGQITGSPSKVDVKIDGKKVARYKVWPVTGSIVKSELYGWLRLKAPKDQARAAGAVDPPGYCRWPQYGEEYFKQLTAEQLLPQKTPQGFTVYAWTLPANKENHYLDARVYARAAADIVGLDRFTERDWRKLEAALATNAPPPSSSTPDDTPPSSSSSSQPVPLPGPRRRRTAPSPYLS